MQARPDGSGGRTPARPRAAVDRPPTGPALGLLLALVAAVGMVIAAYLAWNKINGLVPPCLPGGGCATVEASDYSSLAGIPVAAFGVVYSAAMLLLGLVVWRQDSRPARLLAYGLGLAGVLVEAYLVYLELFVIGAVCVWCAAYGVTVVLGFGLAAWQVSRPGPASAR